MDLTQYLEEQTFENPFLETEDDTKNEKPEINSQENASVSENVIKSEVDTTLENGGAIADDPTKHDDYDNRFDCSLVEYDGKSGQSNQAAGSDTQKDNIIEAGAATLDKKISKYLNNSYNKFMLLK